MSTTVGPWLGWRRGVAPELFASDLWDPFGFGVELDLIDDDSDTRVFSNARVDLCETDDAHIFRADLPGARKDELRVQVEDGNVLRISGERTKEEEEMGDKWHRVERRRGSFTRRFRLPVNVDLNNIKSSLEDGVLSVTVPKKEREQRSRNVRHIAVA